MTPISHNIGVLGAGQLGRMLAISGYPLGQKFGFYGYSKDEPSAMLGHMFTRDDAVNALEALVSWADVITYESENTDVAQVRAIEEAGVPVCPGPEALWHSQHRGREKALFAELGIPTAPNRVINTLEGLKKAVEEIGLPVIVKTTTEGYDGKGQYRMTSLDEVEAAWHAIGQREAIVEGMVPFRRELSMIAVRGRKGEMVFYPLVENHHHQGILRLTLAPAPDVSDTLAHQAREYMRRLMERLDYVGVLTLELFETESGLVANEMAPRVHNSGHWSIEGAQTSQFENHVRAITGLPLGMTGLRAPYAAMINIIGETGPAEQVLNMPDAHLHLYDKAARPGRKLGHITLLCQDVATLENRLRQLSAFLPDGFEIILKN